MKEYKGLVRQLTAIQNAVTELRRPCLNITLSVQSQSAGIINIRDHPKRRRQSELYAIIRQQHARLPLS
jgi:hypothetical protein